MGVAVVLGILTVAAANAIHGTGCCCNTLHTVEASMERSIVILLVVQCSTCAMNWSIVAI